jgi:hypothetical protein
MLEELAKAGAESIVSWQPHGKAFRVHLPEVFAKTVMPRYFKQTKYKSFLRQLHIYGFHRIRGGGMDAGAYFHSMFIRNNKSMILQMSCCQKKSSHADVQQYASGHLDFYSSATNVENNQSQQDGPSNLTNALHSDPHGDEGTFAGKRFFFVRPPENEKGVDKIEKCFSAVVNTGGGQTFYMPRSA